MSKSLIEQTAAQVKIEKGDRSTVIIEGEVPFELLEAERKAALEAIGKDIEIDGFRKGHVPEKILISRVGEMALITEMAERALAKVYPAIVTTHKLDVVGRPEMNITKIAANNPLGFKATVAVMPLITLPDYKALAKTQNAKKEPAEVTEKDVADAIERVQRQKLAYDRAQAQSKKEPATKNDLTLPTPDTVTDDTDIEKMPLPELTDTYVATLGNFSTVEDFKKQFREHLEKEKREEVAGKHRAAITDAIVEKSALEVPHVMIDAELGQMFARMNDDLSRAGLTLDAYLEHVKKSREDLSREWTPTAEKRAKLQLVLNEIAKKEDIKADPAKVTHDVAHLMSHYKDADPLRVRIYVESMLQNEAVLAMLESQ